MLKNEQHLKIADQNSDNQMSISKKMSILQELFMISKRTVLFQLISILDDIKFEFLDVWQFWAQMSLPVESYSISSDAHLVIIVNFFPQNLSCFKSN